MILKMNKKKFKLYRKLVILFIGLFIVLRIFTLTLSKFESNSESSANIDIAFYLLKEDYQSMNISLDNIFPSNIPYVYNFSISNVDGEKVAETNLTYDLKIKTTTNLPLTYELYLNEEYNKVGASNIITNNQTIQDEYDTYFKELETATRTFLYTEKKVDTYQLVIYFPIQYNSIDYQDIIEGIEITVDSKQIV